MIGQTIESVVVFKGLMMDRLCCWHQLPSVLSRRAGRSRGCSPSDRPAARQHTRELMSTTQTYPWLIPFITWCWPFPFVSTKILLIKSNLKLESRAIAVGVAMSPRNLGGKYRCRPHPRSRKFTRQFFCWRQSMLIELHQSGVIAWRLWQHRRSCGVLKSWISVAHCPFQRKWRVLHIWYISVLKQVGMSFDWDRPIDEGLAFVQAGVPSCAPWWRDAPLVREFQMWGRRCKQWDSLLISGP